MSRAETFQLPLVTEETDQVTLNIESSNDMLSSFVDKTNARMQMGTTRWHADEVDYSPTSREQEKQLCKLLIKVVGLVYEDKIHDWMEGGEDSDMKNKDLLNQFLLTGSVHYIWKEIAKGDLEGVNNWIEGTKEVNGRIDELDSNGLNVLHYAIIFKQIKITEKLLKSGAEPNCPCQNKLLPLQLAILGPTPFTEAIQLLIAEELEVNYFVGGSRWGTALDFAVKYDKQQAVVLLLKCGANPNYCCKGKTSLERAIKKRRKKIVEVMLEKPSRRFGERSIDKERLKNTKGCTSGGTKAHHNHTPFSTLIVQLPDTAEVVLNSCISTRNSPYKEKYEVSFDCSLFENEVGGGSNVCRGVPCSCICYGLSRCFSRVTKRQGEVYEDSFDKHQHPLYKIKQSGNINLLNHPLVQVILNKKLKQFGWAIYYSNLFLYLLLVASLTIFIVLLPNPQNFKCLQLKRIRNDSGSNLAGRELCAAVDLEKYLTLLFVLKIFLLGFIVFRMLVELYQLYIYRVIAYLVEWHNWVEIALNITIAIFAFGTKRQDCFCPGKLQWEAGIVSMVMTWVVLIVWLKTMSFIGIYVTIMLNIVKSFIQVAFFGAILIVGFGLSFYMLFYQPPPDGGDNLPALFSNPIRAILTIIPFTAGDISIESIFYTDTQTGPPVGRTYETLAFIIWISAVIIMSVLFNNLLVGLAVGEVTSVIEKARITTLKKRIELVLESEGQLPGWIHKRVILRDPIIMQPNQVRTSIHYCKLILKCVCITFSGICFNPKHLKYWSSHYNTKGTRAAELFKDIQRITEESHFSEEDESEESGVTKKELRHMLNELKAELNTTIPQNIAELTKRK